MTTPRKETGQAPLLTESPCAGHNLRRAARAISRLYDRILAPAGLRGTQFSMLMAAKRLGPLTVGQLAQALATERTTLTRNLAVLERRGLMALEPGNDRRQHQARITGEGLTALAGAMPLWEKAQAHIRESLGQERLKRLLGDMADVVRACGPDDLTDSTTNQGQPAREEP